MEKRGRIPTIGLIEFVGLVEFIGFAGLIKAEVLSCCGAALFAPSELSARR